jgi:hypothetical protein
MSALMSTSVKVDPGIAALFERCHGPVPRQTGPVWAEAKILAVSAPTFSKHVRDAGILVHCASRMLITSFLSHLLTAIEARELEPIATVRHLKYDETPLHLRVPVDDDTADTVSFTTSIADLRFKPGRADTSVSKLYQGVQSLCILCRDRTTKVFVSTEVPLTMPVFASDSSNADVLSVIIDRWEDLPMWTTLRSLFKTNWETVTCDGAESNLKCERSLYHSRTWATRLVTRCVIHLLSNVQGRVYLPVAPMISGTIALGLTLRNAGATASFRKKLQEIIRSSVLVVNSDPPGVDDPRTVRKCRLFDVCFGPTSYDERRRARLDRLLTSDIRSDEIEFHTRVPNPDLDKFSKELATALLPQAIEVFPRHRWLTKLTSLHNTLLLVGVHNLLRRTVEAWLGKGSKRVQKVTVVDPWEELLQNPGADNKDPDDEELLNRPRGPGKGGDWTKFNEGVRGDVLVFSRSEALENLTITVVALRPQVALMARFLQVSGRKWKAYFG